MSFDHREFFETLVMSEGVDLRYKDESALMRAVGKIFKPFNPRFMVMTTTLGKAVYVPSRAWVEEDYARAWRVMCHELVHIEDSQNQKLFSMTYSMPQGLATLALLSLVWWSWWPLLFLLCLAPLPAPWRMKAEMRGYAMTMAVEYWWLGGGIRQEVKDHIATHFTGPSYYWMWPFKDAVKREIGRWSKRILCEEIYDHGAVYSRVHDMIKARLKPAKARA